MTADDPTKTATSDGTLADTEAAIAYIDAKNEDGWVLTIGSAGGSYTWDTTLSVSVEHVFTIQGASPSNRPTITSTVSSGQAIIITCTALKTQIWKDLIFAPWNEALARFILITGGGQDCFWFTNVKWIHEGVPAVAHISHAGSGRTDAGPYGVISECEILGSGYGFYVRDNNGEASWDRAMSWGARDAVYIEDCTFGNTSYISGRPSLDGDQGCRVVFRNNTLVNQVIALHGAEHESTILDSALQLECMHNSFRMTVAGNPGGTFFAFVNTRGGANYIWGNSFTGDSPLEANAVFRGDYYRASGVNGFLDRWYGTLDTTIAAGSNGLSLPQATVNVASTAALGADFSDKTIGFLVTTSAGVQSVTATGKTATSFTGCSGGTGTMSTGGAVTRASDYVGTQQPGSGHVAAAGQDPNFPAKAWGSVPTYVWDNDITGIYYSFSDSPSSWFRSDVMGTFFLRGRDFFEDGSEPAGYVEYTYPHPLRAVADEAPALITAPVETATEEVGGVWDTDEGTASGSPTPTLTITIHECTGP